jgi:hypothetical protein
VVEFSISHQNIAEFMFISHEVFADIRRGGIAAARCGGRALCRGLFAATFRDFASKSLDGDDRFILVKRDENRILTCILECAADSIMVHDVLTQREGAQWVRRVSSYPKLRLAPSWVTAELEAAGLAARLETAPSGMVRIVARNVARPD